MLATPRLIVRRAREERLPQIAGSLAFTTILSVVPFLAVSFALFTRFPLFQRFERAIEDYLLRSLLPADISRTVLRHLRQFAENANSLTWAGSLFVLAAAIALLLTIENALNQIWAVKTPRPFAKRIALYLAILAVGPPLLGASLWATSTLLGASIGVLGPLPAELAFVLTLGPFVLSTLALTALFLFVPNTAVSPRDALVGGLIGGIGFELGKRAFAAWLLKVPTYKALYGAFATFPVFLLWIYVSWLVTLAAALVAASLGGASRTTRRRKA